MSENAAKAKRAASVGGSVASTESKLKSRSYPLWPEFNDADINAEKWEGLAKPKDKGKSPSMQFYDDPEGRIEIPECLKLFCWKRPQDFLDVKLPSIAENEQFDLISSNEHILHCSVMRTIICQIIMAQNLNCASQSNTLSSTADQQDNIWRPWDLIYSLCKSGKGHVPLYNQFGKYVVKLYWMGCWRKIVVDDTIPFNANGDALLPTTRVKSELWPMILTKAVIKILSVRSQPTLDEIEDFAVLHCLTGWIPEVLPVQESSKESMWNMLLNVLPEWKLPDTTANTVLLCHGSNGGQGHQETDQQIIDKEGRADLKKRDDKDKNKSSSQSGRPQTGQSYDKTTEEDSLSTTPTIGPEAVVCANFNHRIDSIDSFFSMRKKTDASEYLRKVGLSQLYNHPVYLTQIRVCPLEAQPPAPVVPQWKLVRPFKKNLMPSDEPCENEKEQKTDAWLEISSPFIRHKDGNTNMLPQNVDIEEIQDNDINVQKNSSKESRTSHTEDMTNSVGNNTDTTSKGTATQSTLDKEDTITPINFANSSPKKKWIDYDLFCHAFRTITVFHKTETYPHTISTGEFRPTVTSAGSGQIPSGSKKGSAQLNQTSSNLNMWKHSSQVVPKSYQGYPVEDRSTSYLFIDNLEKSELVIEYSVLALWPGMEEKKSDKDSTADLSEVASVKNEIIPMHMCDVGLLAVETYAWKNTVIGQPALHILTTGVRAACLVLPPGRHVLRFTMVFPLGYNLRISSVSNFVFGDEETVLESLQQESLRFVRHAESAIAALGTSIQSFENKVNWNVAKINLHKLHMPCKQNQSYQLETNYVAWHGVLLQLMESLIGSMFDKHVLSFAVMCLNVWIPAVNLTLKKDTPLPSTRENDAATCIQSHWRGMYARKLYRCHASAISKEHVLVGKVLSAFWTALQINLKSNSCTLFRNLCSKDLNLTKYFAFGNDECNKLTYKDYHGTNIEQPSKTWFILFRDVFHVEEEITCLPKLYLQIPTCSLHVIDNDTESNIPQVFQKVIPHTYRKNKKGYTIVAEARTLENPMMPGKWKLRMIGSTHNLPVPVGNLNTLHHVKEIRDYYIPNNDSILFRYTVRCETDHIASIQLETSKKDVAVTLQILDNGKEIKRVSGKGHCIIPAFSFLATSDNGNTQNEFNNQDVQLAVQQSKHNITINNEKKQQDGTKKEAMNVTEIIGIEQQLEIHSYIIQATVASKTWPLTATQWNHVQKLRQQEKEEIKAFADKERPGSTHVRGMEKISGQKNPTTTVDKGKKVGKGTDKTGKDKKSHEKDAPSRPQSQNAFDGSTAFWTLRYVVDMEHAESVEVKKDVERMEEIRAMKLAWESADPGRSIKARQSRLSYTSKIREQGSLVDTLEESSSTNMEMHESPTLKPKNSRPNNIPSIQTGLFERSKDTPSNEYLHKQTLLKMEDRRVQVDLDSFQDTRSSAIYFREQNLNARNVLKLSQIDKLQEHQHVYDISRNTLLAKHEDYRKSCIQDDEYATETSKQTELTPEHTTPEPKNKSAGKKKK